MKDNVVCCIYDYIAIQGGGGGEHVVCVVPLGTWVDVVVKIVPNPVPKSSEQEQ